MKFWQVALALLALGAMCMCWFTRGWLEMIEYRKCDATGGELDYWAGQMLYYRNDVSDSRFPAATLHQLITDDAAGWSGPYLATVTSDPWNNQYAYTSDGSSYTIQSVHRSAGYAPPETIRYCFGSDTVEYIPPY